MSLFVTASAAGNQPIILDFTKQSTLSDSRLYLPTFSDSLGGDFGYDTDKGALAIRYSGYSGYIANRMMFGILSGSTDYRYMRITYMTEDPAGMLYLYNNGTRATVNVSANTGVSNGQYVRSDVADISSAKIHERYANNIHATLCWSGVQSASSVIYIKEIALFADYEDAYTYYGEAVPGAGDAYAAVMRFYPGSNATALDGDVNGAHSFNAVYGSLDVTYTRSTAINGINYLAALKFSTAAPATRAKYMRVVYAADMPKRNGGTVKLHNAGMVSDQVTLVSDLKDTAGQFVLTDTVALTEGMMERFSGTGTFSEPMANYISFSPSRLDNTFHIKAVYFFTSEESANSFTLADTKGTVTLKGNDISQYQIVVPADAPDVVQTAAEGLASQLNSLTGAGIQIVTDKAAASDYEILLGQTNRPESDTVFDTATGGNADQARVLKKYALAFVGNKLVVNSLIAPDTAYGTDYLRDAIIGVAVAQSKGSAALGDEIKTVGSTTTAFSYNTNQWDDAVNVQNPTVFTENFNSDRGYFTEENNAQNWKVGSGAYTSVAQGYALSYVHVYEANTKMSLKWKYTEVGEQADAGILARYCADDAWLKAGYDFQNGEWYIDLREGNDFYKVRLASAKATLQPDTWYQLSFEANGKNATLSVNGVATVQTSNAYHVTPGRVGVYSDNVSVSIDTVELALLSGEGTILKDVVHTVLPDDIYRDGGTVIRLNDGTLRYVERTGTVFDSKDGGLTWTRGDSGWGDLNGSMPDIIRLSDGTLLKSQATSEGYYAMTSTDDGKTWVKGGAIGTATLGSTKLSCINMNDKLFQSPTTGRIFISVSYETLNPSLYFGGRGVVCEFYYSDNKGASWTKSQTDSWEIQGNENVFRFGEAKILECADGTLRMYSSSNTYSYIMYSDSTDGGVTWGPIQQMTDFKTPRASMAFVRDPYAANSSTYYMVWVNDETYIDGTEPQGSNFGRSRLTLAKTTDGKNWEILGDIWRWESAYNNNGAALNHLVNPAIYVTEDKIIVLNGVSEKAGGGENDHSYHQAQRQHIWTLSKDSFNTVMLDEADRVIVDSDTPPSGTVDTQPPVTEPEPAKKGCASAADIGFGTLALVLAGLVPMIFRKRKTAAGRS